MLGLAGAMTLVLALLAGCHKTTDPPDDGTRTGMVSVTLADRPFRLYVPSSYAAGTALPLVVALHGYTSNSSQLNDYFGLSTQAEQRGFLLALPEGKKDSNNNQFWNATDSCCDFGSTNVDDSGYLSNLIDTVKRSRTVGAVFVVGHSNGGFMAHRLACEHADQITAIASLAGVPWGDPGRCKPSRPVSVLQIHGTNDETIGYTGAMAGTTMVNPGAEETVVRWRTLDGCTDKATVAEHSLDLDKGLVGPETTVTTYKDGCAGGSRVELWRIDGVRLAAYRVEAVQRLGR